MSNKEINELSRIYDAIPCNGKIKSSVFLNTSKDVTITIEQLKALLLCKKIEKAIIDLETFLLKYPDIYGLGTPFDGLKRLGVINEGQGFVLNFENFDFRLTKKE